MRTYFVGCYLFVVMQKQLDNLKIELTNRIYDRFIQLYDGNKSKFADACKCDEKAIRKLFNHEQGLTINLLLKICKALKTTPSELFQGIELGD